MDIKSYSKEELLELAYSNNEFQLFKKLSQNVSMHIRRALAQNIHTPQEILNQLAKDPVENVSYTAVNNKNCNINRTFRSNLHMCVMCDKDQRTMDCSLCNL